MCNKKTKSLYAWSYSYFAPKHGYNFNLYRECLHVLYIWMLIVHGIIYIHILNSP